MASVGSVEIDLLLNTEPLKRQIDNLKGLAVSPTLKIEKIEFDRDKIEKGFKDICVPFKFCEGSYERAVSNIKDKFENEKICLNIETQIKIDLTESLKTLEALSKEGSKPTVKKILVTSDTRKAEASIKQISSKPISIEGGTGSKEPTQISVKLSEESLLSIQNQLNSQEFKITVASDLTLAKVATPTVATPNVSVPVVTAATVTVPDKALQATTGTEQSQGKIEKSSEKSASNLAKLLTFFTVLLSVVETGLNIINGVRNSVAKLEPGIIRELRNAPATAIRGTFEGAGLAAGKFGIGKVASGVKQKLEDGGVDINGIKKKVDSFLNKIFTDLSEYVKKRNQKALPPQEVAKYFLPPATSPPLLKASTAESFPGSSVSSKPPDVEYEENVQKKQPEKLKELALELDFDEELAKSKFETVIQSFKDSVSQLSLEDITIESIKAQAVSIVEDLKGNLSGITVDSVKEQVKTTADSLREIASDVTIESVKDQVKSAIETLKENTSDLSVEGIKETVKSKASEVKTKVPEKVAKASDKLPESVKAQALGVAKILKENLSNITVDSVKLQVKTVIETLKENLSNLTIESVKSEFLNIIETFKENLSNITVESIESQIDVVLEKVKTTFNEVLEKLPKTKEEAKEKIKAGGVKLRDKAASTAAQVGDKSKQLAGKVQAKAGDLQGVVDSLSDKGFEDYKKIFEDLSKQLGVKLGSVELPKIEAASDLADQVVAVYNELTNTIVLPQNIIDLLNAGVGNAIAEKGEEVVSDAISFLTHELTHAFQVVKDIPSNISNIDIPDIGQKLMAEIEVLADKSTGEYLKELQKLNPGKSLEFLKNKYAQTIQEVKKREKEAYIVQLKLTDGIVSSFKKLIPENGSVQKGVDSVIAKAKTVAGDVSGRIPKSAKASVVKGAGSLRDGVSEAGGKIQGAVEDLSTEIRLGLRFKLAEAYLAVQDIREKIENNNKGDIQPKTPSSLAAVQFKPSEIKKKVLENTESVLQTIEEAQQKLEDEAKLQEFDARLGEKIVKPKKVSKTKEAVREVFNPASFEAEAKELADAAKEIKLPTKKNKDNNKQALSRIKQSLTRLARVPLENINKRRDRIMAAMSVEIELRAEEIKKQLPDNIEQNSVIFATGGFAGKGGAGTADLAKQIEEQFRDSLVVPVANKTFDTVTKVVDGLPKWLGEIIKDKILKQNIVDGVIPDAKELAAQAKAYAEKYNIPVRAIGHSGGGFVVQQAVKQAQAMDVDLKGVGIGTPDIGLLQPEADPNYQAYLAKDDPLRKAAKPLLGRGKTKETSGIGISASDPTKGHSVENYLKDIKLLNEINKHFNLTSQKTSSVLGVVSGLFKKVGNSIKETIQPFEAIGRRIAAADKKITNYSNNFVESIEKIKDSSPMLRPFIDAIQALSPALLALTIFKTVTGWMTDLVKSSFEITAKFQAMDTVTRFLAGSTEKYASRVTFLSGEIGRLSIDIEAATRGYNKLSATTRGTVLEGVTNELFTGVAQAGAAFNLTSSEVEGSILALSQIAGKGVVSMEELRGQLAERIPGAFQIAARSMNMTEQQLNALIATGSLTAVDFLPKFARQLSIETAGSIEKSSQTANAAMTRFQNSFKILQVSVGKPLQPIIVPGLDIAAKGLEILSKGVGVVAEAVAILTIVSFVHLNKTLLLTVKNIFSQTIAIKSLGGALISLNNVIQRTITPTVKALAAQTLIIFGLIEVFKVLKFTFDTFFSETTAEKIEKTLSERFDKAAEKSEELRKKLAKLRGEIDDSGVEKNKGGKTNLGNVSQEYKEESEKSADFTGLRKLQYGLKQWQALSKDIKENRNAKAYVKSASTGEFKVLSDEVNTIISSSDEIIAKSKEKSDAISKLTAQATFAEGDNLKNIKSQIEILQTELQGDLATKGDGSYGLSSIDDTAQSVSFTLEKLKTDLEDTVQEGPKKVIQDQITILENYQKKLAEITKQTGESQPLTIFIATISKIGTAFQESSRLTEISLSKTKASISENLRENLTKNYTAENTAALEQSGAEVSATIQKLKDTQTAINSLTGTLKASTGGVSEYFDQFKNLSLEKLQSELQKTDDKDEARKRTLEALIKLRESESSKVEIQATLQEQLLQQERERMRVAQENFDRQLAISRAQVEINDANNQSVSVRAQIQGGSSQADIGLIGADNQLKSAQQKEILRQQELAGIRKLQADKLISAKDYENKVRELTVQGAQNSLTILQARLGEEQALRAKNVETIQRQLEQVKAQSESKQTDIGFNIERTGFDVQQNTLREQISTGKSDEINKQLEYQKQFAEKAGDISRQEQISAEIYRNQLSSLVVKQDLQTKSLELTQSQQRLEMQRAEMQAQIALLESQSQVSQLQANKATAEEIAVAQQTVDIRQKQLGFIDEQKANLNEVQQLEKDSLAVQNESQKNDLERSRTLQVIEEAEKRITTALENQKAILESRVSRLDLSAKLLERQSQILSAQQQLSEANANLEKQRLDYQLSLASLGGDFNKIEQTKASIYLQQREEILRQHEAQKISFTLSQKQQEIELQRQHLQAQSALLEAQANVERAKIQGVGGQQLAILQQSVGIQQAQLDAVSQQRTATAQVNAIEAQRLGIESQIKIEQLDQQRQLELIEAKAQEIVNAFARQREELDLTSQSLDINSSSLQRQSNLLAAQSGVSDAINERDAQRLNYQLEIARTVGDATQEEQLKQAIYQQQVQALIQKQAVDRESLKISSEQKAIDLERQKIQAEIALLEAQANIEEAKVKGVSEDRLASLQKIADLRAKALGSVDADMSNQARINALENKRLSVQQQTALEQLQQSKNLEDLRKQQEALNKAKEDAANKLKGDETTTPDGKTPPTPPAPIPSVTPDVYLSEADLKRKPVSGMTSMDYPKPPGLTDFLAEFGLGKTAADVAAEQQQAIQTATINAQSVYLNGQILGQPQQPKSDAGKISQPTTTDPEARLKAANQAIDDYIANFNAEAEQERLRSGLTAEQATAGGFQQAKLAREEAARIRADLASGRLKTTQGNFTPEQMVTPLQKLQQELNAAQKAVDQKKQSEKKDPAKLYDLVAGIYGYLKQNGGGNSVDNLVIVSSDPTGDAREVLNQLTRSKRNC